jgi:hypothetical protein
MSRDTDTILEQVATSALRGVVMGFREMAAIHGGDTTLSLDDIIEVLQATVDDGIKWAASANLHSVKV